MTLQKPYIIHKAILEIIILSLLLNRIALRSVASVVQVFLKYKKSCYKVFKVVMGVVRNPWKKISSLVHLLTVYRNNFSKLYKVLSVFTFLFSLTKQIQKINIFFHVLL